MAEKKKRLDLNGLKEQAGAKISDLVEQGDKLRQEVQYKADDVAQKGMEVAVKLKDDGIGFVQEKYQDLRLKQLHPIFAEDFQGTELLVPHMIQIVDYDKRMQDPLCKGAVGWIDTKGGIQVMHLYTAQASTLGFNILPGISCDSIYYEEMINPNNYILLDSYFEEMQKSKFAELEQIAYKLGARSYRIEVKEEIKTLTSTTFQADVKGQIPKAKIKGNLQGKNNIQNKLYVNMGILAQNTFDSSKEPTRPDLAWYANDKQLLNLIEMRCSGDANHQMSSYCLEFGYSSSKSINRKTALKLDAALKEMKCTGNTSMVSVVEEESRKKLIMEIEF